MPREIYSLASLLNRMRFTYVKYEDATPEVKASALSSISAFSRKDCDGVCRDAGATYIVTAWRNSDEPMSIQEGQLFINQLREELKFLREKAGCGCGGCNIAVQSSFKHYFPQD